MCMRVCFKVVLFAMILWLHSLFAHVIFKILSFCYVGIWTLTSTWGICKWVPFKNFKSCFFIFCFVGLLWFWGFGFIISSNFHRLFIKVLFFLQLGSLLLIYIAQFCSTYWILDSLSQVYMQSKFQKLFPKKKKKKSAFVSY